MLKFPHTADQLLDLMDEMVPEVVPEAGDDLITIQRQAAKRQLIKDLKFLRDQHLRVAARTERKARR